MCDCQPSVHGACSLSLIKRRCEENRSVRTTSSVKTKQWHMGLKLFLSDNLYISHLFSIFLATCRTVNNLETIFTGSEMSLATDEREIVPEIWKALLITK